MVSHTYCIIYSILITQFLNDCSAVFISFDFAGLVFPARIDKLTLVSLERFSVKFTCPHQEKKYSRENISEFYLLVCHDF